MSQGVLTPLLQTQQQAQSRLPGAGTLLATQQQVQPTVTDYAAPVFRGVEAGLAIREAQRAPEIRRQEAEERRRKLDILESQEKRQEVRQRADIISELQDDLIKIRKSGGSGAAMRYIDALDKAGIIKEISPVLEQIAKDGVVIAGDENEEIRYGVDEKTGFNNFAVIDKNTNEVKEVKVIEGSLPAGTIATARIEEREKAKLRAKRTENELKQQGLVEASLDLIEKFPDRLVEASDTGASFIKLRPVPTKFVEKLSEFDSAAQGLQKNIDDLARFNLKTDPISGRIPLIGENIQVFTKSPEFQTWKAQVGQLFQDYRTIKTGAAAADKEIDRLEKLLPAVNEKNNEVFVRKSISFFNAIDRGRENILNNLEDTGFDVTQIERGRKVLQVPESLDIETPPIEFTTREEALEAGRRGAFQIGDQFIVGGQTFTVEE